MMLCMCMGSNIDGRKLRKSSTRTPYQPLEFNPPLWYDLVLDTDTGHRFKTSSQFLKLSGSSYNSCSDWDVLCR